MRNQSLFTPFTYKFPKDRFQNELENNRAVMSDFHNAKTSQDKLRVIQGAQITAESIMQNLDGFINDFGLQLKYMHTAFESFSFGFEQLFKLQNKINKMDLKIAEYECKKMKTAK